MASHSVVCSQIGAREHYAVPRALARLDCLDTLLTDLWAPPFLRGKPAWVAAGRRFGERYHPEIPDERVVTFSRSAWRNAAARLWTRPRSTEDRVRDYLRVGVRFGQDTAQYLAQRIRSSGPPTLLFSYTTGALEALELFADWGTPTIVDQIDPARTEDEIVRLEEEQWAGWATPPGQIPDVYFDRLAAEWKRASIVVVNSEWSRTALVQQGVPPDKLRVLPLAYDAPETPGRPEAGLPVRTILWLGQVVLRKGIQYLIAAARLLSAKRLRFVVAGPIGISIEAVRSAPSNMCFIGPITRDRTIEIYRSADLFVFPTLSDGFGVTQLEAMAHGLPVIATRNCGEVVEDGVNGLVVPARDPDALAKAIEDVAFDDRRLASMSAAALETSSRFSVQMLSERMRVILDELRVQS
jgi:glycosyltransferase involved in cell wall biosynthesis